MNLPGTETNSNVMMRPPRILRFGTIISILILLFFVHGGCGGGSENNWNTITGVLTPLPAPANFRITCCTDGSITVAWDEVSDQNNIGYQIYNCSETECSSVKERIDGKQVLTKTIQPLSNGVEYCFAISGLSSNSSQQMLRSDIICGTPLEYWAYIYQLSPGNNATINTISPVFVFSHADTYYHVDYFDTIVKDSNNEIVMNKRIQAYESDGGQGEYSVLSSDIELVDNSEYSWIVTGHVTNVNAYYSSPTHSFTISLIH